MENEPEQQALFQIEGRRGWLRVDLLSGRSVGLVREPWAEGQGRRDTVAVARVDRSGREPLVACT